MIRRLVIVISCFLLSWLGLLASFLAAADYLSRGIFLIPLMYFLAWLALTVMSMAWILGRQTQKYWPIGGTMLGLASLLAAPIEAANSGFLGFLAVLAAQFLELLPLIALAYFLVRYHLDTKTPDEVPASG
jgi:hypothetical protein